MTDNPGTSRQRVGHVARVGECPLISTTLFREARRNTQPETYETVYLCAKHAMHGGMPVIQLGGKSSPKRSGRSFPPPSSQDKGLKNG
jgi:hypothetical protein